MHGLGFRLHGLGLTVHGLGFKVYKGAWFRVWGGTMCPGCLPFLRAAEALCDGWMQPYT